LPTANSGVAATSGSVLAEEAHKLMTLKGYCDTCDFFILHE
jgi:hypothetical protein